MRADHKVITKLLALNKLETLSPEQMTSASNNFAKVGGSWQRFFGGSLKDHQLLVNVLKQVAGAKKKSEHC